ncbi:WAT1-related protein [Hirschfeldia incana]|nr:WAT1-related protein [Hirschfeldia incana]
MNIVGGERSSIVDKWAPAMAVVVANTATGSVNALVKKALDGGVNHMVIGAYRLAISALILAPLAYFLERKTRPQMRFKLLIDHFISGLIGASLVQFFFMLGLLYTSATVSGAFLSMIPAITFALSLILRMESVRDLKSQTGMLKVMGTLICVSGALLLTFYKGPQMSHFHSHPESLQNNNNNHQSKTNNWLLGCLYAAIGASFFSMWMLFQGNLNIKYPCKYTSTCLMSIFGSFQCALLSLYKRRDVNDWVIDDKFVIFVIVYAGIVGQAMSTVATTWSIKKLGAVFASTFSPIMLISATLFDFLILHTPLYLGSIIGSVVVVTGLYVYLWGKNKEMKAASTICPPIQNEDKYNTNDD